MTSNFDPDEAQCKDDPQALMLGWYFPSEDTHILIPWVSFEKSAERYPEFAELERSIQTVEGSQAFFKEFAILARKRWGPSSCQHKWINVGFSIVKMACKICDANKPE